MTSLLGRTLRGLATLAVVSLSVPAAGMANTVDADFNRDGVLDSARLVEGRGRPALHITLSGRAARRTFVFPTNVQRLVAVDLDGDGALDLIGRSPRRGLVAWVNRGAGRFVRLHRPDGLTDAPAIASVRLELSQLQWPVCEQGPGSGSVACEPTDGDKGPRVDACGLVGQVVSSSCGAAGAVTASRAPPVPYC